MSLKKGLQKLVDIYVYDRDMILNIKTQTVFILRFVGFRNINFQGIKDFVQISLKLLIIHMYIQRIDFGSFETHA